MRSAILAATFVILLLLGFVATPGIFKVVNPEYLLALREYSRPLAQLAQDANDLDARISTLQTRVAALTAEKSDLIAESTSKQANLAAANAPKSDMIGIAGDYVVKIGHVTGELDQATGQLKLLQEKRASIDGSRSELRKKLETSTTDSTNIYTVTRALALGAIGAMMSIFAKHLAARTTQSLFDDIGAMGRMWISMAMGAIVSVVVIGLFFTGFISIFANAAQNPGDADFWKVTILCLLAGAFSDRLFEAAAARMESYIADKTTTSKDGSGSPRSQRSLSSNSTI